MFLLSVCVCVWINIPDVMCHHAAKRWGGVFLLREYPQQKKTGSQHFGGGLNIPKDPDMSWERDYPYIPILGMGLRPSILF